MSDSDGPLPPTQGKSGKFGRSAQACPLKIRKADNPRVLSGLSPHPDLLPALKRYYGYESFRPGQLEIITAILQRRDLLAILPTGAGKSLCFQLPALLQPGLSVVVSPLIALMQDQVEGLRRNGIAAACLNSSLGAEEARRIQSEILDGQVKLLYCAPERLLSETFLPFLDEVQRQVGLSGFVIDEAHCVSEWGHDFRPEYRQLERLRRRYSGVPCLAFTATATERVRQDIAAQLCLQQPFTYVASFNRPNLYFEVRPKDSHSYRELLTLLRRSEGASIVYCLSRKRVDETAAQLCRDGIEAVAYHAGLSDSTRSENQRRFIRDDAPVIVATVAFGMGIDKPDVRQVIHYDLPRSIEGYYQESGRAGRDGEASRCLLFYALGDLKTIDWMIAQKVDPQTGDPLEAEQRVARQQLRQVIDYAEGTVCRRTIQLSYFGESFGGDCGNCDNCLSPQPQIDRTVDAQKFLSCVARCRERFGATHIIDVLRGSQKQRIRELGHDRLSTWGIGRDRSIDEWRLLCRSLLHQGLLEETTDGYPVLRLNAGSWAVMKGQQTVKVALPRQPQLSSTSSQLQQEQLFEQLRRLRKQLADEQGVPPYQVFPDRSLREMCQTLPQDLDRFGAIAGVGRQKLLQYGDTFLAVIRAYCDAQGLEAEPEPAPRRSEGRRRGPGQSHLQTLQLFREGHDPEAIAQLRDLRVTTVCDHLAQLIEDGTLTEIDRLISPEELARIVRVLDQCGGFSLRPAYDALDQSVSYERLKIARAWWQRQRPPV